ncbi:CynX/NimT family MFS transporter [Sulfitobacter sabulilitoris]|uniref:MFS transporter n=1 Tax=Sulfitobacter sabulilitoris TaxID=2562655 RepID=A0A5S3PLP8_9RHOB|nr:MFS transporter [Sulfitobacter sabulilitoris]TMM55186.1 MFS transporter [Sulfitobacter sabulilitoris]
MRWRILALLFLARIGLGLQFQTLASVGDSLTSDFGLDYAGVGLLIGLFMLPGLFLALPAGYLGRFATDRQMVVTGLGALALGGLVSSIAADSAMIGVGRLIAGAGFLSATLYFTKMVADWFEGREIATAMSILVMSWPFGIAMGQVGHAWLQQTYGWQVPFQAASAYCLIAALGVHVLYQAPHDLPAADTAGAARMTPLEWQLIICAAGAWAVFNAGYVTYLSFGPKVLEGFGQSALAAAGIISIGSWVMIVSGAVCGQIADRFGRRDVILTVCMGGAIAALMLLGVPRAGFAASLVFGLVGMAPAGVIMAMAGQALRPQVRAFGMGIFFTIYFAIMMAAPPVAGAILDLTGQEQGPMLLAMALFALVVPLSQSFRYFASRSAAACRETSKPDVGTA